MNPLSLYSPFARLLCEFDTAESPLTSGFQIDIEEEDTQYRIHADLPGIAKEQVSLSVEDNVLSIRAKFQRPREQSVYAERVRGDYARAFRLPRNVAVKNIQAAMNNGVLTLTLPKAEDATARKIEIH